MPKRGWFKALGQEMAGIFNPALRAQTQQTQAVWKLIKAFESRAKAARKDPGDSLQWLEAHGTLGPTLSARQALDFVEGYVAQAPKVLACLMDAAGETSAQAPVMGVIMEFGKYLDQEDDLIPDGLGSIGLADDAYFAQRMTTHLLTEGGGEIRQSNKVLASLLPAVIVNNLDSMIQRSVRHVSMSLRQFASQRAIFQTTFEESFAKTKHPLDPALTQSIRAAQ